VANGFLPGKSSLKIIYIMLRFFRLTWANSKSKIKYNLIVYQDVIQYVPDDGKLLANFNRVLRRREGFSILPPRQSRHNQRYVSKWGLQYDTTGISVKVTTRKRSASYSKPPGSRY